MTGLRFSEVLPLMRQGRFAAREDWPIGVTLAHEHLVLEPPLDSNEFYTFYAADIVAEDWRIVDTSEPRDSCEAARWVLRRGLIAGPIHMLEIRGDKPAQLDPDLLMVIEDAVDKWERARWRSAHPVVHNESDIERSSPRYREWRQKVLERDKRICQKCGTTEGRLCAHHIKSWTDSPDLRYELSNGTTLCWACHVSLHSASTRGRQPKQRRAEADAAGATG